MASHLNHNTQEPERSAHKHVLPSRAFRARSKELPDGLDEGSEERRRECVGVAESEEFENGADLRANLLERGWGGVFVLHRTDSNDRYVSYVTKAFGE
jgi:hypothetical protein